MRHKFIIVLIALTQSTFAQLLVQEKSEVKFFSDATLEDIAAVTTKGVSLFEMNTGEFAFEIPIKSFQFDKSLMREHFNEKYLESDKFPKATFAGKLSGYSPTATGAQQVSATGKMTLHGQTQAITVPGTIELTPGNKALIKAKFVIRLEDYKIKIPSIAWQNIAEEVEVTVEFYLTPKS